MQDRPLGGTMDWDQHAVVLDVPEDAVAIHFGLLQDGPGISWIDDASLEVAGAEVPVTDLDRRPRALVDGGFELPEASDSPWLLTGVARDDFRIERTSESAHRGQFSMKMTRAAEHPRGFAAVEQSIRADDYRGKRVRASAWIRGPALPAGAHLYVRTLAPDAPAMSPGLTSAFVDVAENSDWRRFDVVIDVPEAADAIVFGVGAQGRATMFIDEAVIDEVAATVPLTSMNDTQPAGPVNLSLDAGATTPEGWSISGGARSHYRAVVDRVERHQGVASARFEPVVEKPLGYGTLAQGFSAHDYRGQRLRMTAYVKGKGVDGRGDLWLRVQAVDSPGDGYGLGGGSCVLEGDFDWRPCSIVFDVPSQGSSIQLGVGTTGHGTLWLDDVRFEEVDRSVPLTNDRSEPRALLNGGFDDDAHPLRGWFLSGGGREGFEASVEGGAARLRAKPNLERDTGPLGYGTLMQSIQAEPYWGKRLRMRSRVRGEGLEAADVWLRVQSATSPGDGPGLGGGSCPLEGTFDYEPCEIVFDVPERGSSIQIGAGIRGDGSGTLWLDDVVLEEVDRGVRVTSEVHDREEAENLGFEPR